MSAGPVSECCLRDCDAAGAPSLRLAVTPPPDGAVVTCWTHEECFAARRDPSVDHDDPRDHGHIPGNARCVFCGGALPRIGTHPYVVDIGSFAPPHRFWAHAACLTDCLVPALAQRLQVARRAPREGGETP